MKLFGTDGIRGIANDKLTVNVAYRLGRALAIFYGQNSNVLIARDNRISGQMLIAALEAGLMEGGVNVTYLEIATSPAISFLTKNFNFTFSVMVTASHNIAEYNGLKVFNSQGEKISEDEENAVEKIMFSLFKYKINEKNIIGTKKTDKKLIKKYIEFLKQSAEFKCFNPKICIDCANGGASKICKCVCKELKINAKIINTSEDGKLINKNSGATYATTISNAVIKYNAVAGFALDGDADRILVSLSSGKVLDGDAVLYFLSKSFKKRSQLKYNEIVATTISNFGLDASLKKHGVKVHRTQVGDSHVYDEIKKRRLTLGGEKSGHIINGEVLACSDGLLVMIYILNELCKNEKSLALEISDLKLFKQVERNIRVNEKKIDLILQNQDFKKLALECDELLVKTGRILIRKSGTENIIRILVEGQNEKQVEEIANLLERKVNELLNQI